MNQVDKRKPGSCIGIRTHGYGVAEERLYSQLLTYFAADRIFFVIDETKAPIALPDNLQKVSLSSEFIQAKGLFAAHAKIGWLCGDYFYYALREAASFEHYWLVEPDVAFVGSNKEFFGPLEATMEDFVAARLDKAPPTWGWYRCGKKISPEVYQCIFPLTRLSGAHIDRLLVERMSLSERFVREKVPDQLWPNDESFVATASKKLGASCVNIKDVSAWNFELFSTAKPLAEDLMHLVADRSVVHPVLKRGPDLNRKIRSSFRAVLARSQIRAHYEHCLTYAHDGASAEMRNMFAEVAAKYLAEIEATKTAVALPEPKVRALSLQIPAKSVVVSGGADYKMGDVASEGEAKALNDYAPYCFDHVRNSVLMVDGASNALNEAFFYQGQRLHGRKGYELSLSEVPPLGRIDCSFAFSIGRCGSTLLSKLAAVAGFVQISEADAITNLARLRKSHGFSQAVSSMIRIFGNLSNDDPRRLFFKLRSGSNVMLQDMVVACPDARFYFVVRDLEGWAKSFIRKFGWGSEQLIRTLTVAERALERCGNPGDITILQYEDIQKKPLQVLKTLAVDVEQDDVLEAKVSNILAADSQEGSGIEAQVSPSEVQKRWEEFVVEWMSVGRPLRKYVDVTGKW